MTTIALSPQMSRADIKSDVIIGFTLGLKSTPEMVASVECGGLPDCVAFKGEPWQRHPYGPWTVDRGSVRVPAVDYLLSAERFAEVAAWLDRVSPGWEADRDAYGNPAVRIHDAAPQRALDAAGHALAEAWSAGPGQEAL
jgi:hypothetical protein